MNMEYLKKLGMIATEVKIPKENMEAFEAFIARSLSIIVWSKSGTSNTKYFVLFNLNSIGEEINGSKISS